MLITGFAALFLLAYHLAQINKGINEEWKYTDLRLYFYIPNGIGIVIMLNVPTRVFFNVIS